MTSLVTCKAVAGLRQEPGLFPALRSTQATHASQGKRKHRMALHFASSMFQNPVHRTWSCCRVVESGCTEPLTHFQDQRQDQTSDQQALNLAEQGVSVPPGTIDSLGFKDTWLLVSQMAGKHLGIDLLSAWVTRDKSFPLSEPQFPHL